MKRKTTISTKSVAAFSVCLLLLCCTFARDKQPNSTITPVNLRCEAMVNPIGIDHQRPSFSWLPQPSSPQSGQRAYRIMVRTTRSTKGAPDVWDSGKVTGDRNYAVYYEGPQLKSRTRYFWQVQVWDQNDAVSTSELAFFETALMSQDEWQAKWIGGLVNRLRKVITIPATKTIVSARAYVSGLGYFELYLNESKVGDEVLSPGQTRYNEHNLHGLKPTFRAVYRSYDVTPLLTQGENVIGIMLGQGKFGRFHENIPQEYKAILHLAVRYDDGSTQTFTTDGSWRGSKSGPVVMENIFDGEKYDATLEDDWLSTDFSESWEPVKLYPHLHLDSHLQPVRVTETLKPVSVARIATGLYSVDFGQNLAGWVRLKVKGPRGTTVQIRVAERRCPDLTLDTMSLGGAMDTMASSTDRYTLKGEGEEVWEPRFTYHGFQFAEIAGVPGELTKDNIVACAVHDDVDFTSTFETSNKTINAIYRMFHWGLRSNMHSIPTDCCNRRERSGWTGDALVTCYPAMQMFDLRVFYKKYFDDMDSTMAEDGRMLDVVPLTFHCGFNPGHIAWHGSRILLPWRYYWVYGDKGIFDRHWEPMKKYMTYLRSFDSGDRIMPANLAPYGGDHTSQVGVHHESKRSLATAYYFQIVTTFAKICRLTGHTKEAEEYETLAEEIKDSFNRKFLKDGYYAKNLQVDNAIPLDFGLVPQDQTDRVLASLVKDVSETHNNHVSTGIPGTYHLLKSLAENDCNDLVYTVANNPTSPGWVYLLRQGYTTATSNLIGGGSKNHPMTAAAIGNWFYMGLAGIRITEPGFEHVQIRPYIPDDMDYLNCSLMTVKGPLKLKWVKSKKGLAVDLTIPPGTRADLQLPEVTVSDIQINGISVTAKAGAVSWPLIR